MNDAALVTCLSSYVPNGFYCVGGMSVLKTNETLSPGCKSNRHDSWLGIIENHSCLGIIENHSWLGIIILKTNGLSFPPKTSMQWDCLTLSDLPPSEKMLAHKIKLFAVLSCQLKKSLRKHTKLTSTLTWISQKWRCGVSVRVNTRRCLLQSVKLLKLS